MCDIFFQEAAVCLFNRIFIRPDPVGSPGVWDSARATVGTSMIWVKPLRSVEVTINSSSPSGVFLVMAT